MLSVTGSLYVDEEESTLMNGEKSTSEKIGRTNSESKFVVIKTC